MSLRAKGDFRLAFPRQGYLGASRTVRHANLFVGLAAPKALFRHSSTRGDPIHPTAIFMSRGAPFYAGVVRLGLDVITGMVCSLWANGESI
jgi:hypothetical protein